MKTSNITLGLFILITFFAINNLVINVSAQERGKCTATVTNINFVFVDPGSTSGRAVAVVYPFRKGYYLNILGPGANYFDVTQTKYMAFLSVKSASSTTALWQVEFAENMGQVIASLKMTSKCTGETKLYKLDSNVRLSNK